MRYVFQPTSQSQLFEHGHNNDNHDGRWICLQPGLLLRRELGELILIGLAACKAILNLLLGDKPVEVFAYLDSLVNYLIADHIYETHEL